MHLAIAGAVTFALWKWADLRHWRRYHATILYFCVCNLLYHYLNQGRLLWALHGDRIVAHHALAESLYTFYIFPATVLLFLSRAPRGHPGRLALHVAQWIVIYSVVEWCYLEIGLIRHQYGWSMGWSILFDCVLFPMLLLHERHPLLTYGLSVVFTVVWLDLFDVISGSAFL
ncbi:CBO0543 family protein [Paenibacillus sp.]|uniref:CBO0543 family protein n=1 Tax=Paenibacillus sp. TaxID=58172 RepID=UPI002D456D09|nr:CBO0543 family protein [Paenibacillus sp.]HZG85006.1 CBO0543 family protein [Paenibacillus sp.]